MTDHDPLCPWLDKSGIYPCQCSLIRDVRVDERHRGKAIAVGMVEQAVRDERERIALAIEARRMRFGYGDDAARIAREQRDENG